MSRIEALDRYYRTDSESQDQQEEQLRRGESTGPILHTSRDLHKSIQPSVHELEQVDFALTNPKTPTGILEQTSEVNGQTETVRVVFKEGENGERVIQKVGVRRD